jgi:hypothetical protein
VVPSGRSRNWNTMPGTWPESLRKRTSSSCRRYSAARSGVASVASAT